VIKSEGRWLAQAIGSPRRPWLVFGSAPNPRLPSVLPPGFVLACINNSGQTARTCGLPDPDLTIRAEHKSWDEVRGLSGRAVLWISSRPLFFTKRKYPAWRQFSAGAIRRLKPERRDASIAAALGYAIDRANRPSNGVFAIILALRHGAAEVIVSGLSLTASGHSYNELGEARKQIEADRRALQVLASKGLAVRTSEKELAMLTSLPFVE
jgi:hypothetical protein